VETEHQAVIRIGRGHRLLILLLWISAARSTPAEQPAARPEYEVKVAYLYHFCRYVKWPSGAVGDELAIGVVGEDPLTDYLAPINARKVEGKPVITRYFHAPADYQPCHLLFVEGKDGAAHQRLRGALQAIGQERVLLVAEFEGALEEGAAVNLILQETTVRFEINLGAVARAGLEMDAKLLRLAVRLVNK
jgi:hypothetical protein